MKTRHRPRKSVRNVMAESLGKIAHRISGLSWRIAQKCAVCGEPVNSKCFCVRDRYENIQGRM